MRKLEINTNWHQWKKYLGTAINAGELVGLSEDNLSRLAYQMGKLLADKVDPANREQRLLKELWDVGTEKERETLSNLIVKMIDHGGPDDLNKNTH